ncbi:hypothetical protein NDU88_002172 [Pleurodeles waltl]|uniref:Uncharacterized protein n=1 Tax=Pleurodeles waltl TaxID=8319 RepID=A0AAV7KUU8_PLEWA|nr:hypothetical protein NDU88_002172 [Pleurodeles waltl]
MVFPCQAIYSLFLCGVCLLNRQLLWSLHFCTSSSHPGSGLPSPPVRHSVITAQRGHRPALAPGRVVPASCSGPLQHFRGLEGPAEVPTSRAHYCSCCSRGYLPLSVGLSDTPPPPARGPHRRSSSSAPRLGQALCSRAGPSATHGSPRLSGCTFSLPHGAEPPTGPTGPRRPPRHLRRSRETRARSPAAPGPSALLLQWPVASRKAAAPGEEGGPPASSPSIKPGSHLRALQGRSGGPAASRAGPQFSAHAQASGSPELARSSSAFPSAPPERWN